MWRVKRMLGCFALRFTMRDLLWSVVVIALLCAMYRPRWDIRERTNRELDLLIRGPGYFCVKHEELGRYGFVRNGHFAINPRGQICFGPGTPTTGWIVQPEITLPSDYASITIENDGLVICMQAGQTQQTQLGQLELARFINPEGLREIVDGVYQDSPESGPATISTPGMNGLGLLEQGRLEKSPGKSNFDPVIFASVFCCGVALICVREIRLLRTTLAGANAHRVE